MMLGRTSRLRLQLTTRSRSSSDRAAPVDLISVDAMMGGKHVNNRFRRASDA
jgi:hypothetical protein